MRYQVLQTGNTTLIGDSASSFRLLAGEQQYITATDQTAFGIATLYTIKKSGFHAGKIYHFLAVDNQNKSLADADLDLMKAAIDYYFREVLDTEYYIKEFPRNSALYPKEAARLFGTLTIAA